MYVCFLVWMLNNPVSIISRAGHLGFVVLQCKQDILLPREKPCHYIVSSLK